MKKHSIILIVPILLITFSCGTGKVSQVDLESDNNLKLSKVNIDETLFSGTRLYGAVLDTAYNVLDDVNISTRPSTIEVKTDEDGNFELISEDFLSDVPYEIVFSHIDYKQHIEDGHRPNIDDDNDLGLILMTPLPPEDNGGGPGTIAPPSTPPDFPEDEGRD